MIEVKSHSGKHVLALLAPLLVSYTICFWLTALSFDNAEAQDAGVSAHSSNTQMTFDNPKTGVVLWKANAARMEGKFGAGANSGHGTLFGVIGTLFQDGKPAAKLTAPTVTADQGSGVLRASGGVTVVSLTQAEESLRCDKLIWYEASNRLVGTGHVLFRKGAFTQTGPSFSADTRLKTLYMPARSH